MIADYTGADMRFAKPVALVAAMTAAGGATAQSVSNCMNLGGGMTHCDNMGSNGSTSSTNCTAMGSGMSDCTTMPMGQPQTASPTLDMSSPQASGLTLGLIGSLIAQSRDRSLQKKVSQMLASGDCDGAARLALFSGRETLSDEIHRYCLSKTETQAARGSAGQRTSVIDPSLVTEPVVSQSDAQSNQLVERLRVAAAKANAATPIALDSTTTVSKVEAIGTQILITAVVSTPGATLGDSLRSMITNELCAAPSSPALLKAGASIRLKYFKQKGQEIGSVMVTREECGL